MIHLTYKGTTVGDRHRQLSHQHIRAGRISGLGTHRPELCAIVRDLGEMDDDAHLIFSIYSSLDP